MSTEAEPEFVRAGRLSHVFASFAHSYALAIVLIVSLIYQCGIWDFLANSRLLDLLVEGGVIQYHDQHLGIIEGVNTHKTYLKSQNPIDYRLLGLACLVGLTYWTVRGIQFHQVGRIVGLTGSMGEHVRALFYGRGLGYVFPHRFDEEATVGALGGGAAGRPTRQAYRLQDFLVITCEILPYTLLGLFFTNYGTWFVQNLWAVAILLGAFLLAKSAGTLGWGDDGFWKAHSKSFQTLANRPSTFAKVGLMSVLANGLEHITPFLVAMAFTSTDVIMKVPLSIIHAGVVAGYIARRIPLTPHGIGQYEWAFAMALYYTGVGFPEAACIAILGSCVRYGTGLLLFVGVVVTRGVPTTVNTVFQDYLRRGPEITQPKATAAAAPAGGK